MFKKTVWVANKRVNSNPTLPDAPITETFILFHKLSTF